MDDSSKYATKTEHIQLAGKVENLTDSFNTFMVDDKEWKKESFAKLDNLTEKVNTHGKIKWGHVIAATAVFVTVALFSLKEMQRVNTNLNTASVNINTIIEKVTDNQILADALIISDTDHEKDIIALAKDISETKADINSLNDKMYSNKIDIERINMYYKLTGSSAVIGDNKQCN